MVTHHYQPLLVALSVLLACAGSYVALTLISQLATVSPHLRRLWRVLTAVTAGLTIWGMHFVGILACEFPVAVSFDPWLTFVSLLVAQVAAFLTLQTLREGDFDLRSVRFAGVFFGVGVVSMHYLGMAAMRGAMTMTYSLPWVLASVVAAVAISGFALQWLRPAQSEAQSGGRQANRVMAALLLGLAISSMHYLGMQAVMIMPTGTELPGMPGQQELLALLVSGAAALICVALLIAMQVDRQFSLRGQRNDELVAQAALEEQRYWTVINALTEGVLIIDNAGKLVDCNDSARQIFELPEGRVSVIQQLGNSHFYDAEGQHVPLHQLPGNRAIAQGVTLTDVQLLLQTPQGHRKWLSMNATPLPAPGGERSGAVVSFKDITLERDYERQLLHQATHDELTLLPNRRQFGVALTGAIAQAQAHGTQLGVLYFDLDHFKDVNDTLGHHVGDQLLQAVAAQFSRVLPAEATPARFGGDEFAVLIPQVAQEQQVWAVAQAIQDALAAPILVEGRELYTGLSMGFSLYPADGQDLSTLLQNADLAMNKVKASGRGGKQRFSPAHAQRRRREVELERAMRAAQGTGQFRLVFQPIYDLADRRLRSCEALLRWTHPELGEISPAEFIPLAEESGMIDWLGDWVLEAACQQARAWVETGTPLMVAVNISMRQFKTGRLPERIMQVLHETGLDPHWLSLEVTETALMNSQDDVVAQLTQIRDQGILVALDDFGTGFSSLQLLQDLPIDKLKLDRSFLQTVTSNPRQKVMVGGIVALAHGLGLKVIAEGIETEQQCQELLQMNCQIGQGYLLSRPLEAQAMTAMLLSRMSQPQQQQ